MIREQAGAADGRVQALNPPQTMNDKTENGSADGMTKDSAAPVLDSGVTTATAVSGADTS